MSLNASSFPALGKDSHTLVLEAREMIGGLAALTGGTEGNIDTLTGDQLYFLQLVKSLISHF